MNALIATRTRRLSWTVLVFIFVAGAMIFLTWSADPARTLSNGDIMNRFLTMPALAAVAALSLLTACAGSPPAATGAHAATTATPEPEKPFVAQVVGVQWLNPLQRRDYPTEWQLLWTMGLAQPNKNDDMVKAKPGRYSTLQTVGSIAVGNNGKETFHGYHEKYVDALTVMFHDIYFSSSRYFYNAHSLVDKSTWRELAGIHVEYALPEGKLDPVKSAEYTRDCIIETFAIGNVNFPTAWTRNTPPDVRVTMGGANAGFTSLSAALGYLQAHPEETVWAMNWDAPSRPKDKQINENMVLLVLAGPHYKTGRKALAWIGQPASSQTADFETREGQPAAVRAWSATVAAATANGGKNAADIGYVIHDANQTQRDSADRIRHLAHVLALDAPGLDFMAHSFNTPVLLGEMGAGTALTNVALGIAYANHFGKNVLVAGTSDPAHPTAVLVAPPATVRPIAPNEPWFRARGENNAYLMWWGIRNDVDGGSQGYSQ